MVEPGAGATESKQAQGTRDEVASILAETLLEVLVPGAGRLGGGGRNALIRGSQHALLLTEKGRRRPSQRGRKRR